MAWNVLDMPSTISSGTAGVQRSYLADGTLVQVNDGSTTRLYLGDMVFNQASGTISLESAAWDGGLLLPGSGTDKVLYYVTDHLGSVRVVKDGSGNIRQRYDYYPYGSVARNWSSSSTSTPDKRYRFGGKEISGTALGALSSGADKYLDFGARLYSPGTAMWISQDPMAEKYYPLTPYMYCAGSPGNVVDPEGRVILIFGIDGTPIIYTPGIEYETDDSFITAILSNLSRVYANGGSSLIDDLVASSHVFEFCNTLGEGNNFQFLSYSEGGGAFLAGTVMLSSFEQVLGVESIAHEMLHAAQHEGGQGVGSIFNEVEAYAYGYMIYNSFLEDYNGLSPFSRAGEGLENEAGAVYSAAFQKIVSGRSNVKENIQSAIQSFKTGAYVGSLYKRFPLYTSTTMFSFLMYYYPHKSDR
jgi:RHS repeat-associated protein